MHSLSNSQAEAIKALDEWLETMKQNGGYGGPVSHWWQSCYQFVGPGLDWRYEGILTGYVRLWEKTREQRWLQRVEEAVGHLVRGQLANGSYANSRFEANPGTLGTPHEAAASRGLLKAAEALGRPEIAQVAVKNIEYLIDRLWDGNRLGFNDSPGIVGRVPNKLATLAEALLAGAAIARRTDWLELADSALRDVISLQVRVGPLTGAIHQWGRGNWLNGDGRFFPYYNARCIPALVQGAIVLNKPAYRTVAESIGDFLEVVRNADGTWPQLLYDNGRRIEYPHWIAPIADILYAYHVLGRPIPPASYHRMMTGQLPSGGFMTAEGFRRRYGPTGMPKTLDYLDVTPVVGWNDKVLRLLAELAADDIQMPHAGLTAACTLPVTVGTRPGWYHESPSEMAIGMTGNNETVFQWNKADAWSLSEGEVIVR